MSLKAKEGDESPDSTITFRRNTKIIEGRIKGGRYGQRRSIGDMQKPDGDYEPLEDGKIVLDDFYFLLYTPVGSSKGILMIQSYSDDNINDIFVKFISERLRGNGFNKPLISPFCPQIIQNEFKENSYVKEVVFREDMILPAIEESEGTITTRDVIVEIKITARNEGESLSKLDQLKKAFQKLHFKSPNKANTPITQFSKKTGRLIKNGHQSSFDLDSNIDIKPVVYLTGKISFQDDGSPNWNSLKKYCNDLLDEINIEVYPEHEVS